MAKRMAPQKQQEHTLPDEIAEVTSTTPVEAPTASVTPDQIADLILKGSDETKNAIRKALDLDKTHTRQRKSPITNSQVRNHVRAVGEVTHEPGFVPEPPSRIADRGEEAVRIWQDRWLDNNGDNLSEYDLDQLAATAHQQMSEIFGQVNAASFFGDSALIGAVEADTVKAAESFTLPSLTTTERNALTAVNGMLIYNSTDNKFQGYEGGSWANLIQSQRMTNLQILQIALRRVGLNTGSSTFKDSARDYLNLVTQDIASREKWNWLFKSSTFNTTNGTRTYSLASDVVAPLSFRNTTEDHVILIMSTQDVDAADPDASVNGDPRWAAIDGVDGSGNVEVTLYPEPDSTDTIAYRYYSSIPTFTVSNDNDSITPYVAAVCQPALIHGISALYKQEKGDDQGALSDKQEMERVIAIAGRQNFNVQGNRTYRMRRADDHISGKFSFQPTEGSIG